jgi:hypothetical protein
VARFPQRFKVALHVEDQGNRDGVIDLIGWRVMTPSFLLAAVPTEFSPPIGLGRAAGGHIAKRARIESWCGFGSAAWTFGPDGRPGGAIENAAMTAAAFPSIKVPVGPPARSPV